MITFPVAFSIANDALIISDATLSPAFPTDELMVLNIQLPFFYSLTLMSMLYQLMIK